MLLMTSGTTAAPKSAVLRHRHLSAYVLSTVEFLSADESDASIVSVPPYHIAAVANLISNLFVGRRIDEAGFIFVQGRADDTIIRGGENIAPSEIESVLAEHESVHDCAVVGVPDKEWRQRIAALVVIKPGIEANADTLRDFVRARLRSSKTPDQFVFLPELPTNATGKVLRRELAAIINPSRRPRPDRGAYNPTRPDPARSGGTADRAARHARPPRRATLR